MASVSWAAINQIPQTGGLNQQTFISHSLEAGKPDIKVPADSVSGEGSMDLFLVWRQLPSCCALLTWWRDNGRELSTISSYNGTNPVTTVPALLTSPPNPNHLHA